MTEYCIDRDIAVIGMSCKFPLADNLEEFWENLKSGKNCIREVPQTRKNDWFHLMQEGVENLPCLGYLERIDQFDSQFFGIAPGEAPFIDPSQRLLLESVSQAFEYCGYSGKELSQNKVGVFVSYGNSGYKDLIDLDDFSLSAEIGNLPAVIAGRISYIFKLDGPSLLIDTACSSSLTAIHYACESLNRNECSLAVVGAVNIYGFLGEKIGGVDPGGENPQTPASVDQSQKKINEDDIKGNDFSNRCRVFDKSADGLVNGEGVGTIILKPLKKALADEDIICAIIKGSAVNHNAGRTPTLSAQRPESQTAVMFQALENAGIGADILSYFEASGAATEMGDPIEVDSITEVFSKYSDGKEYCSIGCVKANIGHLNQTSGIASVIKTILSIQNKQIPPLARFKEANPHIDFRNSPVYVNTKPIDWKVDAIPGKRRLAGINSFSINGTNCTLIIEEPPLIKTRKFQGNLCKGNQIFTLSAKNRSSLQRYLHIFRKELEYFMDIPIKRSQYPQTTGENYQASIQSSTNILSDMSYTLNVGRNHYPCRIAIICNDKKDLLNHLSIDISNFREKNKTQEKAIYFGECQSRKNSTLKPKAVLLFPDGNKDYVDLLADFSAKDFVANQYVEECRKIIDLSENDRAGIFAFQYALSKLWIDLGIKPAFVLGVGVGKYVSKVISRQMTLSEALDICTGSDFNEPSLKVEKFKKNIDLLLSKGQRLFLEIGPGSEMGTIVQEKMVNLTDAHILHSYDKVNKEKCLLSNIALLYTKGLNLDFSVLSKGKRMTLPAYPFDRKRYWVKPPEVNHPFDSFYHSPFLKYNSKDIFQGLMKLRGDLNSKNFEKEAFKNAFNDFTDSILPSQWIEKKETRDDSHIKTKSGLNCSSVEKMLLEIMRRFFGIEDINPEDNFFQMGGDSLKALTLISIIQKELHANITLKDFFNFPKIKDLANFIEKTEKCNISMIVPVEKREYYVLSSVQKRLYFLQAMEPETTSYNMPFIMTIEGELNKKHLEGIFKRLVKIHESLRTSFCLVDDIPRQIIADESILNIQYYRMDLNNTDDPENHISFESPDTIIEGFIKCFNLSMAPLLRVGLLGLPSEIIGSSLNSSEKDFFKSFKKFILMLDIHHIISDAFSHSIMIGSLMDLFEGKELPVLKIQYRDFSNWLDSSNTKELMKKQQDYWHQEFSGEIPVLNIPTDFPRPAVQSFEGDVVHFHLDKDITKALNRLVQKEGTTLFVILLSVLNILLAKITNQEDIIIGTPSAGRPHPDLNKVIGMFLNTLSLRNITTSDMYYIDFLRKVKKNTLNALENQYYPFEELVDHTTKTRDVSRNPLFDVLLVLNNVEFPEKNTHHLKFKPYNFDNKISKFDFTLHAIESYSQKIFLNFEYCTKLFKKDTINRFIDYFKRIIKKISMDQKIKIGDIDILDFEEKQRILSYTMGHQEEINPNQTIHELFEEGVELLSGEPVAVGYEDKAITYNALNSYSDIVSIELKSLGVEVNSVVGILLDRSIEMIVGILAILKAGSAYLPIDASYPKDRISYMLADSRVDVTVTTRDLFEDFKDLETKQVNNKMKTLFIDETAFPQSFTNPFPFKTPHTATHAYIIYTSGSTGKPKGVIIDHRNVCNLMKFNHQFTSIDNKRLLQFHSIGFDASFNEIFFILLYGGVLFLIRDEIRYNIPALFDYIKKNQIETLFLPMSILKAIFNDNYNIGLIPLCIKHIQTAGEQVVINENFRKYLKSNNVRLHNHYGPSETHVVTTLTIEPNKEIPEFPSIGRPILNTSVYLVNKDYLLVPIGVTGELYIGGRQVGSGYLNNPELTAEKFDHDFWDFYDYLDEKNILDKHAVYPNSCIRPNRMHQLRARGQRLYRTGDLGRWQSNGNIEFLGRLDHQVKIRGYRVELGEIENQILDYPGIKETIVIANENENKNKFLIAYIVAERELENSNLRYFLSQQLPDYMLPSYFIPLKEMPLNPSGKLDRKALPKPDSKTISHAKIYASPRNVVERKLVEVWQEVLGDSSIGINDSFFEIGGDSIKAIQITSKMNRFGYNLNIRDLLKHPRISELAPLLKKIERKKSHSVVTGAVPLTGLQHWIFNTDNGKLNFSNQSVILFFKEALKEEIVKAIFSKIQEHHDALRMTYKLENNQLVQVNHGLNYPLMVDVVNIINNKNSDSILRDYAKKIQKGFDMRTGPIMKLVLFHMKDGDCLLINLQQLATDRISMQILLDDFHFLYFKYKKGEPLKLPPKTDSFKSWSEELNEYSNSQYILNETKYWSQLETKQIHKIKKDFETEEILSKDIQNLSLEISKKQTDLLLDHVNYAFKTEVRDILITALGISVKKTLENDQLLIYLQDNGRKNTINNLDISRTVGEFSHLFPVHFDFSFYQVEGEFSRQIKEVKENLRQVPQQGMGYLLLKKSTISQNKSVIDINLKPQIIFSYFEPLIERDCQESFTIERESIAYFSDLQSKRFSEFEISCHIINRKLNISIAYSKKQFRKDTIENLLKQFQDILISIIHFCSTKTKTEPTPSDLTYKELSIDFLQRLNQEYCGLIEDIYPLSPMQEGMLFFFLLDNNRALFFEQMSYHLKGELDFSIMVKTINQLVERHEILRTAFIHTGVNRPLQIVLKERSVKVDILEFSDINKVTVNNNPEKWIREFLESDRKKAFDLSKDILLRVTILKLAEKDYQIIWSTHHILLDGWGIEILLAEFFEIYSAFLEKRKPQLSKVKPYRSYIQWLEIQDKHIAGDYWKKYLKNYEEVASIPKKKNLSQLVEGYKLDNVFINLEEENTSALNKIAVQNHVTLNTLIQTVWGIVLGKYCGKRDVVFGVLISGRPPEVEGVETMVGCFVNTIPMRITFDESTSFAELLQWVQENTIKTEPHYYFSLAEIQSYSSLKQNLFDHMIQFQNYPIAERLTKNRNNSQQINNDTYNLSDVKVIEQGNYDFNVIIVPREELFLCFSYNAIFYDRELVQQIGINSIRILEQIVENDEINLGEINFLSEEEKRKILYDFNNNLGDFSRNQSIHHFVEVYAEKCSDGVAILEKDKDEISITLTYSELNDRLDSVAGVLQNYGIQEDEPVCILMDRSIEMVISILATWAAGGAYIPIDLNYPPQRIIHILKHSQAKCLIAKEQIDASFLNEEYQGEILSFHLGSMILKTNLDCSKRLYRKFPHNMNSLAYIIYTSGSTGAPKGVMIEHIGMMNHIQAKINDLQLNSQSIIAQNANHTFDISIWQFFAGLTLGAKTNIYSNLLIINPDDFILNLINDQVSILEVVPSYLSVLLDHLDHLSDLSFNMTHLLVTGEEIKPLLVKRWFSRFPHIKMVNAYGPTEASDDITHFIMDNFLPQERVPIGKPIQNLNIYIVDQRMQLCPIGIKGEICVAGVGVGRGYWGEEEKTKQVFLNDPFSNERKIRLYKTGDLGRWLPDGNIEFFGRMDYQVKIRGFRIEMGEIENQLLNYPSVKDAVVLDSLDKGGNKFLCAYVVFSNSNPPHFNELSQFLLQKLPEYMIPAHYIKLDFLPLTSNGKVDRKVLPEPDSMGNTAEYIAPTTQLEKQLVKIWAEILEISQDAIGMTHSFFDLGGHSLKLIMLISKIKRELQVIVPLAEVFKVPTIENIVSFIATNTSLGKVSSIDDDNLILINMGETEATNIFMVHDGSGEVEGYLELTNQLGKSYNFWGLKANILKGLAPQSIEIEKLAERYIQKIKMIQPKGPYVLVGWSLGGTIAFEMTRILEQLKEQQGLLILIDVYPSNPPGVKLKKRMVNNHFNKKSEIKWLQSLFREIRIKDITEAVDDIEQIWTKLLIFIEEHNLSIENLMSMIPEGIVQVLPPAAHTSIQQCIYSLNMIRSLTAARDVYIPAGKIDTKALLFISSESQINRNLWLEYFYHPLEFITVSGDHFSVLRKPHVQELADKILNFFKRLLNKE